MVGFVGGLGGGVMLVHELLSPFRLVEMCLYDGTVVDRKS